MMVRSAVKLVSKTLSNPQRRSAVFNSNVKACPGSRPKHSPIAARGLGAVWMITCFSGLSIACQTSSVGSLALSAPVGQRLMHWPQLMQTTSASGLSMKVVTLVRSPRSMHFQHAHLLQVDARADAAAAEDALVHVADHRVARRVDLVSRLVHVAEAERIDAVLGGQRLQLAVLVAAAGVAVAVVAGQQQIDDVPPGPPHLGRVGADLDRRGDRIAARGLQGPLSVDLDDAHPADPRQAKVLMVAERRDANAQREPPPARWCPGGPWSRGRRW